MLTIALRNLLDNAWKYTGKTPAASVEFGARDEGGRRVFFLRDNGAGFDMAYADRLFSPFQRLHSAEEFPGTGVGLATVARIIHRHHGEIRAEGRPCAGATFSFTLGGPLPPAPEGGA
jgi:light-regulated signal transduction histidine kinase (bacteriophytochrome)